MGPELPSQNQSESTKGDDSVRNDRDILEGLASLPFHQRMSHFARGSTRHWVAGGITVVDFRPLYTIAIHDLQRQLAGEIQKIETEDVTDGQLEHIRETLHKYTDALRDFEFIHANRWDTQFVKDIAASRLDDGPGSRLQGALISEFGLKVAPTHRSVFRDSDVLGSFDHSLMRHSTAIGESLGTGRVQELATKARRMRVREMTQRVVMAILGGLIIVVPMMVIVLGISPQNGLAPRALAVVSTSILLFALVVAFFSHMKPENLLAATAAYAAVLVTLMSDGPIGN